MLPALRITVTKLAERLGVTRQQVHRVLAEQSAVSPDMAWRLGKLLGNGPELWIRMQEAHDLWHARKRLGRDLDKIQTLTTAK